VRRPVSGPLTVATNYNNAVWMYPAVGNTAHFDGGAGVATDFILYITADSTRCIKCNCCSSTLLCDDNSNILAYAFPIAYDDVGTDRPLMGAANLCPGALRSLASGYGQQATVDTLTHEILHALARPPRIARQPAPLAPLALLATVVW